MPAQPSFAIQLAQHPAVFAIGVGVANGVLAAVRNKPVSPTAAYVTAAVIAAGEVALVRYSDEWERMPPAQRPDMWRLGIYSALGTMVGLALFVSWQAGKPSYIQRAGERLAERAAPAAAGY